MWGCWEYIRTLRPVTEIHIQVGHHTVVPQCQSPGGETGRAASRQHLLAGWYSSSHMGVNTQEWVLSQHSCQWGLTKQVEGIKTLGKIMRGAMEGFTEENIQQRKFLTSYHTIAGRERDPSQEPRGLRRLLASDPTAHLPNSQRLSSEGVSDTPSVM